VIDDRKLGLALSDVAEEHLLTIHPRHAEPARPGHVGRATLAEVFGSILSLALAVAASDTVEMLDEADVRDSGSEAAPTRRVARR